MREVRARKDRNATGRAFLDNRNQNLETLDALTSLERCQTEYYDVGFRLNWRINFSG